MSKRHLILIVLIVNMLPAFGQGVGWYVQLQDTTLHGIGSIDFKNADTGMATSYDQLLITTNGGRDWTIVDTTTLSIGRVTGVQFVENNYWIINGRYGIAFSSDDGQTWSQPIHDKHSDHWVLDATFKDLLHGVYLCDFDTVHHTSDQGVTWIGEPVPFLIESDRIWYGMEHGGDSTVILLGREDTHHTGGVAWSTNYGERWTVGSSYLTTFNALCILNDSTWLYGAYHEGREYIFRKENYGEDGFLGDSSQSRPLTDIDFLDEQIGYAVGLEGIILRTEDGGRSWRKQHSPTNENLSSVDVISKDIATASGNGIIIRTETASSVNAGDDVSHSSCGAVVWNAFPSPASEELTIQFDFTCKGAATLELYNSASSERIFKQEYGCSSQGLRIVTVDVSAIASGMYFIRVVTEGESCYLPVVIGH